MSRVSCREGRWGDPQARKTVFYRFWRPEAPRTLLVMLHGFGEYGGRYQQVAQALADEGICVAVPDVWGHGRSSGARGDIGAVDACIESLQRLTEQVFVQESGCTTYSLFGHSFGGLLAICWGMSHPAGLRYLAIQSPLLGVGFEIPGWKTRLAAVLARVWPTCALPMDLDATLLSHEPAVVEAYRTDPLVHNRMSARTYESILQAQDDAFRRAPTLQLPALILCGTEDRLISVPRAQQWVGRLACEKRIVLFPGCFHELHHEPVRGEVIRLVNDWVAGSPHGLDRSR